MALVDGFVVFDGGDRLIEAAGVLEHAALLAGGLVVGVFQLAHCVHSVFVVNVMVMSSSARCSVVVAIGFLLYLWLMLVGWILMLVCAS